MCIRLQKNRSLYPSLANGSLRTRVPNKNYLVRWWTKWGWMVLMLPRTPPTHPGRPASRFTRALEAGRYLIDQGTMFG